MFQHASNQYNALPKPSNIPLHDDKVLIGRIFRSTWDEYMIWKNSHDLQVIQDLALVPPSISNEEAHCLATCEHHSSCPLAPRNKLRERGAPATKIWSGNFSSPAGLIVKLPPNAKKFKDYPTYEACSPLTQNMFTGDDTNELPFMPYSDDCSAQTQMLVRKHADTRARLGWLEDSDAHNWKTVILETARQLNVEHGISLQFIDASETLPLKLLSSSEGNGLIRTGASSDHPPFPNLKPLTKWLHDQNRQQIMLRNMTLEQRLNRAFSSFCSNRSCIQPCCTVHPSYPGVGLTFSIFDIPQPLQDANKIAVFSPSVHISNIAQQPCSRFCTLLPYRPVQQEYELQVLLSF